MDKRTLIVGLVWDIGLPALVFYGCWALGVDVLQALAAGGAAALVRVAWAAVARRRLDGLAALVSVSFLLLLVVSLLTGDPRILLARESILSGAAGLVLTGSCLIRKPVIYAVMRRLAARKPKMQAALDQRWQTQPSFRRHFFTLSAVFGVVLLTEATLRIVLIYLLPVGVVAGVSAALHLGTLALLVCWALWYRNRRRRAVADVTPVVEETHAR